VKFSGVPEAMRVVIPDSVLTAPKLNLNEDFSHMRSAVFLRPKVLEEALPAVSTKVTSATSDQPPAVSSWATTEVGKSPSNTIPPASHTYNTRDTSIGTNPSLFVMRFTGYSIEHKSTIKVT
jgi:hypothetical protein